MRQISIKVDLPTIDANIKKTKHLRFTLRPLSHYIRYMEGTEIVWMMDYEVGLSQVDKHCVLVWLRKEGEFLEIDEIMEIFTHEIAHRIHDSNRATKEEDEAITSYVQDYLLKIPEWSILIKDRLMAEFHELVIDAIGKGYKR
jgi:hypothetical protein